MQGTGQASRQTGRIFTVAALQREKTPAVGHNMNPVLGQRVFPDSGQQGFTTGMLNRAGQLTAAAAETEFRPDQKFFHDEYPPLNLGCLEKLEFLFEYKTGEDFNRRNTLSILRIKI